MVGKEQRQAAADPTAIMGGMVKRDFVSLGDLGPAQVRDLLDRAALLKRGPSEPVLAGKSLALLFQKPSLRTKISFDVAMTQLGGHCLYLSPDEVGIGKRETAEDVARVVSRYVDCIAARTFSHREVEVLARYSRVPVVNALSDAEHPCQALADLLTIEEQRGALRGTVIAYVGDGNNVAASLLLGAALTGATFRTASPAGYALSDGTVARARAIAGETGAVIEMVGSPQEAVLASDVVYTDVWTSMGQEDESARRGFAFNPYQVTEAVFSMASPDAIFLHPLPAHRGEEVTAGVMEHERSVVFEQAENRLHANKAVLIDLLGPAA